MSDKRVNNSRKMALGALLAALAIIIMYTAVLLPVVRLGMCALAGLTVAIAVVEYGTGAGVTVYAVASLLAAIVLPDKVVAAFFILFFGHYPIIKSLIERMGKLAIEWILKLMVCNVSLALIYFVVNAVVPIKLPDIPYALPLFWLAANAVFAVYDYAFSRVAAYYIYVIRKRMR